MKKIKIYVCLIVAIILLDSCVQVCVESEKKFVNSTSKYPNLTAVKVDDIKNKINQDNNFKIIYIYEVCDNLFGKYISQNIIPYTEKHNNITAYAIASNCGWLKGIEPEFNKHNIKLTPYYLRDNSPEYILYNKEKGNNQSDNRITRIAKHLFVNANSIEKIKTNNTCFVVNKENKIKLARLTCNTKQGKKSIIVPCPIEKISEPLNKVDFNSIIEINIEPNINDYLYLVYFSEYDY